MSSRKRNKFKPNLANSVVNAVSIARQMGVAGTGFVQLTFFDRQAHADGFIPQNTPLLGAGSAGR